MVWTIRFTTHIHITLGLSCKNISVYYIFSYSNNTLQYSEQDPLWTVTSSAEQTDLGGSYKKKAPGSGCALPFNRGAEANQMYTGKTHQLVFFIKVFILVKPTL